tara:strand:- start:797 stop:991 length:195 start_codon:yes stop_codon:yes gene_type:complete
MAYDRPHKGLALSLVQSINGRGFALVSGEFSELLLSPWAFSVMRRIPLQLPPAGALSVSLFDQD